VEALVELATIQGWLITPHRALPQPAQSLIPIHTNTQPTLGRLARSHQTVLGRFIIPLGLCLYFAVNRKRMAREEAVRKLRALR